MTAEDLYDILRNPNNPIIKGKKEDFEAYGIDIKFEDEALKKIAESAYQETTGARGLVSAVEKVLLKFEKKLPSTVIKKLVVTKEVVEDPQGELKRLLADPDRFSERFEKLKIKEKAVWREMIEKQLKELTNRYGPIFTEGRIDLMINRLIEEGGNISTSAKEISSLLEEVEEYRRDFSAKHGIKTEFSPEAIDKIIEEAIREKTSPSTISERILRNYEHGLKLLRERSGRDEFLITQEAIGDPEGYLNRLIKESYQ